MRGVIPVSGTCDGLEAQAFARGVELALQARHQFARGQYRIDDAYALPATPDVLPWLLAVGAEVHHAGVTVRQCVGVQPGRGDRAAQVVAVHAGEQVRINDVAAVAADDHLLVVVIGTRLFRGD